MRERGGVVLHGVLHQHLQGERCDQAAVQGGVDVDAHVQAALEAHAQQVVVRAREGELRAQVHHLLVLVLQDVAVHFAQLLGEARRLGRVLVDQRHQGVQAVEEEVRTELVLQCVELRAHLLSLDGLGELNLAPPLVEEVAGLVDGGHQEGDGQVGDELGADVRGPVVDPASVLLEPDQVQPGAQAEVHERVVDQQPHHAEADAAPRDLQARPPFSEGHHDQVVALPHDPHDQD